MMTNWRVDSLISRIRTVKEQQRNSQRDDILCSIAHAQRGMAKARARGDLATFNYFLGKAGEHRRELAEWKRA
jgi:hypothetical protein